MHLYLEFSNQTIKGEGTDYVGPWVASGKYSLDTGSCSWVKKYLGKHEVHYQGTVSQNGITGQWSIGSYLRDQFHIWPKSLTHFNEMYLNEELTVPSEPSVILGNAPVLGGEQVV